MMYQIFKKLHNIQEKAFLESIPFSMEYFTNSTAKTETIEVTFNYFSSTNGITDRRVFDMTFSSEDAFEVNDKKADLLYTTLSETISAKTRFIDITTPRDDE